MKRPFLLFVVLTVFVANCQGQKGWRFRSEDYAGVAIGERGSYGQLRTVNGFYRRGWFLGLGTGLDYYGFRSIPLLLSVSRDLPLDKRNGLFVYADAGANIPWYVRPQLYIGMPPTRFHAGPAWGAGLGYAWNLSARGSRALLFSAGYSMKKLKEAETDATDNYLLRAWLLRLGFRF
ncbi:MAG TPA: hypothetical protein VL727_24830 [Puia sp.]|nr:hypothetical protein [Puia sp.]